METTNTTRIDEINVYYEPARVANNVMAVIFWASTFLALTLPYTAGIIGTTMHSIAQGFFIVLVVSSFCLAQSLKFFLIPKAEHKRRRQLLSDAFSVPLIHEETHLYYNNSTSPSLLRLGANVLENSLFGKEITSAMLVRKRIATGLYVVIWIFAMAYRHNNLAFLTWLTQIVFSGQVLAGWLALEILYIKHCTTYDMLYAHFLNEVGDVTPKAKAAILDAFAAYECSKAVAGIQQPSKLFHRMNAKVSAKWEVIKVKLKMHS